VIRTTVDLGAAKGAAVRPDLASAATWDLGRMATVDEALALVTAAAASTCLIERVRLEDAGGRVLAAPIIARRCAPACDVSAMDGYAVRDADLAADWTSLRVLGQSFAGCGYEGSLEPGTAVRAFTGAPTPQGADRVVVQEDVRRVGDRVFVPRAGAGKRHIRLAGSDFRAGDVLVEAGVVITPQRLVAVAAADLAEVEVLVRPRVLVVATGDELRSPGEGRSAPGSIPESVSFGVAELARNYGAEVTIQRRLPDDLSRLQAAANGLTEAADVVVVIGGASVGERDYSRAMFEPAGLRTLFSKVAMRPGKPVWFGQAGGAHVVGLPGNPSAALVTARLFLAPLIAGLAGRGARSALTWRRRPLADVLEATGPWECFVGARLDGGAVRPFANRDSSSQKTLADVEVLVRRGADEVAVHAGDFVETLDF
jgi:molybdopterin molybdotransferase